MHDRDLFDLIIKVPRPFWQDITSDLKETHREAPSQVEKKYTQPQAKDLIPHIRRAIFEDKMKETASKHGFASRSVLNKAKNANHTEIEIEIDSKKIILTALSVQTNIDFFNLAKVKKAEFRKTLAEPEWLFEEYRTGDGYYGIILHAPNHENMGQLEFAHLAFPQPDCSKWHDKYNLFDLAGGVMDIEVIIDNAKPKLRTNINKEEQET